MKGCKSWTWWLCAPDTWSYELQINRLRRSVDVPSFKSYDQGFSFYHVHTHTQSNRYMSAAVLIIGVDNYVIFIHLHFSWLHLITCSAGNTHVPFTSIGSSVCVFSVCAEKQWKMKWNEGLRLVTLPQTNCTTSEVAADWHGL